MHYSQKNKGNKTSVFIIIFMFIMIIPITAILLNTTITTVNPVYGQQDQTSFNATDSSNIHSIPTKKVQVGDIEIAYKTLGKGEPILLYNGASDGTDAWDPSFLMTLFKSHSNCV